MKISFFVSLSFFLSIFLLFWKNEKTKKTSGKKRKGSEKIGPPFRWFPALIAATAVDGHLLCSADRDLTFSDLARLQWVLCLLDLD